MSKIDAGRLDIEYADCPIDIAIEQTVSLVVLDADKKSISIDVQCGRNLPERVLIDGGRVQQVVANLLSNAIKYSDHGKVRVHTRLSEEPVPAAAIPEDITECVEETPQDFRYLSISVSDQGIGIAPEDVRDLFVPFTQFAGQTAGSSGLGLTICKHICEMMGGDIRVESQPGYGSTFTVRMLCGTLSNKRDDAPEDRTESIDGGRESGRWVLLGKGQLDKMYGDTPMATQLPMSILLADDYKVNRMVQQAQLESLGYRADAVANGEEVLARTPCAPVRPRTHGYPYAGHGRRRGNAPHPCPHRHAPAVRRSGHGQCTAG